MGRIGEGGLGVLALFVVPSTSHRLPPPLPAWHTSGTILPRVLPSTQSDTGLICQGGVVVRGPDQDLGDPSRTPSPAAEARRVTLFGPVTCAQARLKRAVCEEKMEARRTTRQPLRGGRRGALQLGQDGFFTGRSISTQVWVRILNTLVGS